MKTHYERICKPIEIHGFKLDYSEVLRQVQEAVGTYEGTPTNPVQFIQKIYNNKEKCQYAIEIMRGSDNIVSSIYGMPNLPDNTIMMGATHHLIYQLYHFVEHGKKIFRVSEGLCERLINTNLNNVSGKFARLPYKSIYVEIPPKFMEIYNKLTGNHRVYGIYATESPVENGRLVSSLAAGQANDNSVSETDDGLNFLQITINDNEPLKVGVKPKNDYILGNEDEQEKIRKESNELSKLLLNVMLYISSKDIRNLVCMDQIPDFSKIKNKKKLRIAQRRSESMSNLPYYNLGREIIITGSRDYSHTDSSASIRRKISYRFEVMGHWRTYDNEKTQKTIWIEPHERGPKASEIIDRTHKLK